MKEIKVSIKGVAPLLQHKMSLKQEAQLASKTKKQSGQGDPDEVESYLYLYDGKILFEKNAVIDYIKNEKSKWAVFWDRYGTNAIA